MSIFTDVMWFDSLDSTNSYLKDALAGGSAAAQQGAVVAAREQLNGRGRKSRVWLSAQGENLTFSFVLAIPPERRAAVSSLTLTAGVAVCEALGSFGAAGAIKWPNDILINGRKICGILCETAQTATGLFAVCGIGINVNMDSAKMTCIDKPATSLFAETGICYRPEDLLEAVLASLDKWLGLWLAEGFPRVRKRWMALACGLGLPIDIVEDGIRRESGFFCGISESGSLLLRLTSGEVKEVFSGDVVWMEAF
ncbi:MAG: biotin--[acetyl-CoA-carboxylase] ligase [Phycisphaerae bacterium]